MYLFRRTQSGDKDVEIMYWRKADAIHNWFVKHGRELSDNGNFVDADALFNLGKIPVDADMMEHLIADISAVLRDHSIADIVLPAYEYDDIYFDILDYTLVRLRKLLKDKTIYWGNLTNNIIGDVYYTCWW